MGELSNKMVAIYEKKLAPYLEGGRPKNAEYFVQEKLKVLQFALSELRIRSGFNPYVHGRMHADVYGALNKMGYKKIFQLYDNYDKRDESLEIKKEIFSECCKFVSLLSMREFWLDIANGSFHKIPNEEKLLRQYESYFNEIGAKVDALEDDDYIRYISSFIDVYNRFPLHDRSYYLIGLSIIEPKLLRRLHRKYGSENLADAIIDWGKQQQIETEKKQERRGLLSGIFHSCLMAVGTGGAIHSHVSPIISSCMASFAGLLAFNALLKYRKSQKKIDKRKEEQRFFTESPEIIDIQTKIKESLIYKNVKSYGKA